MNFLTRLSLANRALVALAAVGVLLFGAFTATSLKRELFPSINEPALTVTTAYPGAAPAIVESALTRKVEDAVKGAERQTEVTSVSAKGVSSVQVSYEFGVDLDKATSELQQRIARIQPDLPERVTPSVAGFKTEDLPAIVLTVAGPGDQQALARRLESVAVPRLSGLAGVREVKVDGARDDRIEVDVDPARLRRAGGTTEAVANALKGAGVPVPAGSVRNGALSLPVQVGETLASAEAVRDLRLVGAERPARLGDVASVRVGPEEPESLIRVGGRRALALSVLPAADGNTVGISHRVRDELPALAKAMGGGVTFTAVFDGAPAIEEAIGDLTTEGLLGLAFSALVILVFLFSLRSTLVTLVSIPVSLLIALIGLGAGGFSLNLLTLSALTVAIGRVVDDSIVVIENIKRHLGYGEEKRSAILGGVREVAGAVVASTLTTVAVFLPIAFTGGIVGALFSSFSLTVTIALLASLLVSLTLVPVLAYWFLKAPAAASRAASRREAEDGERSGRLQRAYVPVIRFAVRRRWVTLGAALAVFVLTAGLGTQLKTSFLDDIGGRRFTVRQEMPPGTGLEATEAASGRIEAVVRGLPHVKNSWAEVGSSDEDPSGGGTATVTVELTKDADSEALQNRVRDRLRAQGAAGRVTVDEGEGSGSTAEITVFAAGAVPEQALRGAADRVVRVMRETSGTADVRSDLGEAAQELRVRVDPAKAAALGLTETQVGQAVAQATQGEPVAKADLGGRQGDVVLRVGAGGSGGRPAGDGAAGGGAPQGDARTLAALEIPTPAGRSVRLGAVAAVTTERAPVTLTRIDGRRAVTVKAKVTGGDLGKVNGAIERRVKALPLPEGVTTDVGGTGEEQDDSFADLALALGAAILIVYLVMVGTFRSLVHPLTLLVSVPFAATGAIGLLVVTGTPLGLPALIGALMLVGIVVTNAIVLLDLVRQYREAGMSARDAVVEGGRHRVRPVLMTALATVFALVPMALGLTGEGGFISRPLAVVVIGGLTTSTVLTLVLIPTLYTIVEDVKDRFRRRRGAGDAPERDPEAQPVG
ncbi:MULTISPECIES: efflux RND transporter permease subunit [Actinomadura]|uniref:Efflux RND transporter permease subunit n=1 Tax=Actinomadura yumaensis TaxID=111807 RepID=A0ABW2CPI9_9ACTN|nr:efflux RND transporter permease subunit [Actinomadura sp. J1-007]MWK40474.1 MMPL family transporter [Actinomadura sp. J1-007]